MFPVISSTYFFFYSIFEAWIFQLNYEAFNTSDLSLPTYWFWTTTSKIYRIELVEIKVCVISLCQIFTGIFSTSQQMRFNILNVKVLNLKF